MDIRDIKEKPLPVESGEYLQNMYMYQTQLISHYTNIEGLPSYPLNVNTKENQQLLKDFSSRVTEELAEGYESFEEMGKVRIPELTEDSIRMFKNHWQNGCEEQADAMHFLLELLIFANIHPKDIERWVNKKAQELNYPLPWPNPGHVLEKAFVLGAQNNKYELDSYSDCNFVDLYSLLDITEEEKSYLPLRYFNQNFISDTRMDLWDITQAMNIGRNCLKNKPWKQTQELTNEGLFQSKLVEAFVYLCGYYAHLKLTPEDIYTLYFKKNQVNQFRIRSKY